MLIAVLLSASPPIASQTGDYAAAEVMVRNHQWDEGLALVEQLLKKDPNNTKELNLAGLALIGKGDIEQANEYFRKVLLVSPGFVPALKNLGIDEFNQKQYDAAQKHLLRARKEAPQDPIVNLYVGEIAYRAHKYQQAADAFVDARDFVFRNPNAAAHLAVSYLQIDQQQKALDILDRVTLDQIEPQTQFALGLSLVQLGLVERAIPYLEAVERRYPDSYDIGFDLTLVYISARAFPKAIDKAKDLIGHGHETSELNNVLAEAYEGNNEIQHAVDALRRAIALDPADEDNYLDFASLCMNQRSLQAGMKVIQVALESHPKSDRLIFMRGVLYAMQDEFERAEADFKLRRISHRRPILVMWASAFLTWRLATMRKRLKFSTNGCAQSRMMQASFICWVRHCFGPALLPVRPPILKLKHRLKARYASIRICVCRTSPWGPSTWMKTGLRTPPASLKRRAPSIPKSGPPTPISPSPTVASAKSTSQKTY
jgi:tetratricopeptide (TPR) repeat protein